MTREERRRRPVALRQGLGSFPRWLGIFVALWAAWLCAMGAARAEGTLRTVLVIDASSSMRSTDPRGLRKVAAELFVDLARTGDEIAVTGFDGGVRESTGRFIRIQSVADRETLKQAVRAVGNDGSWTDFTQGLSEARRILQTAKAEPGDQAFVVFLTDGRCDPDPKGPLATEAREKQTGSEAFCKARVIEQVVPGLKPARVYAIGLSRSAPKDFLEDVARRTGGVGQVTDKADELPRLFADVYARLLGSTLVEGPSAASVPIQIDEGALSLDVVVVGPPSLRPKLTDPTGAEVPQDNAAPELRYFVDTPAYRFFKVIRPPVGTFQLAISGPGTGRYAALQNLDLRLTFVDPPEVAEIGRASTFRVRLATPGGRIPAAAFLDRHVVQLRVALQEAQCGAMGAMPPFPLKRGPDGVYGFTYKPDRRGRLCLQAELYPGPSGVLSRESAVEAIRVVPPLHLAAQPIGFGKIKQGSGATAVLSFEGSEIGEAIEIELAWEPGAGIVLSPVKLPLAPDGVRTAGLTLAIDRDAPGGPRTSRLGIVPIAPRGFGDRRIEVDVTWEVVPLTFWERYGFWIKVGAGAALFLFLLLGVALPARFRRTIVLHTKDARDPELPREATYPLGVKAKAGFYRGAKQWLAVTGPVRAGGIVLLTPGPSGGIVARPAGGRGAIELPAEGGWSAVGSAAGAEAGRKVTLVKGTFRCVASTRYEIEGTGLVFWYTVGKR